MSLPLQLVTHLAKRSLSEEGLLRMAGHKGKINDLRATVESCLYSEPEQVKLLRLLLMIRVDFYCSALGVYIVVVVADLVRTLFTLLTCCCDAC